MTKSAQWNTTTNLKSWKLSFWTSWRQPSTTISRKYNIRLLSSFIQFLLIIHRQSEVARERSEHENYAFKRNTNYIHVPTTPTLDEVVCDEGRADGAFPPGNYTIVTGESGLGKSSMLANWWISARTNTTKPIFAHFLGASSRSSSFGTMVIRIFEEINEKLVAAGDKAIDIPNQAGLVAAIPKFLQAISLKVFFPTLQDYANLYCREAWFLSSMPSTSCQQCTMTCIGYHALCRPVCTLSYPASWMEWLVISPVAVTNKEAQVCGSESSSKNWTKQQRRRSSLANLILMEK